MKKLGKLSINLNRVMKNEELVNLRGGYEIIYSCSCNGTYIGDASSPEACTAACVAYWEKNGTP